MLKINSFLEKAPARDKISTALFPIPLVFVGLAILALLLGILASMIGSYVLAVVIGACIMAIVLLLRQDEWAITVLLIVQLYVDWYLGVGFISLALMMILLPTYFLRISYRLPSKLYTMLWIWMLLLVIAILPATRAINLTSGAYYYFNVIGCAFMMFYLGAVITRNSVRFRRFLRSLTCYSVIIAVITIIQTVTGKLWFSSTRYDPYLTSIGNYRLSSDMNILRTGSFFINPNPCGAFFAMMLLLPLGLFFESSTFLKKAFYFIAILILLPALAFSYSTGAWLSFCIGIIVFLIFVGRTQHRFLLLLIITCFTIMMLTVFSSHVALQLQHAEAPDELLLRSGAWQTGIQVIRALPLSGLGLGRYVYAQRAEPYRVITQYRSLDHPHDSFLELAALGGLPVAIVFIILLLFAFWLAIRNWFQADVKTRSLIAGGIASATALTIYSLSDAGWTVTPLLTIGWLILGAISTLPGQTTE